jgi:uncharacterized protein
LGRTRNGTLDLRSDARGLRVEARVPPTSFAKDLRISLERGDIDQGSFAFTVAENGDAFATDDDDNVMRTIRTVGNLYDVTVTAKGAYPTTSMKVAK